MSLGDHLWKPLPTSIIPPYDENYEPSFAGGTEKNSRGNLTRKDGEVILSSEGGGKVKEPGCITMARRNQ